MIGFQPLSKKTVSIQKTLLEFAKEKGYAPKDVDFSLDTYETFVRDIPTKEDTQLESDTHLDTSVLRDKTKRIYQKYTITLTPSELDISPFQISLHVNADKTKVTGVIKKGSLFQKDEHLKAKIIAYIWHKKLRSSLLIDIFEEEFLVQLGKLLTMLPYGKKLSKDVKINVAKALPPLPPKDAKLELLYEQDERTYIEGVQKGELLIRYTKPKPGKGGRSCEGRYIAPKKPLLIPQPDFDAQTISVQEDEEYILYFANKEGFVEFENNRLKISNTLKLQKADFKTTGDLASGDTDTNISVEIAHKQGDAEDAIGSGVKVEVKELSVDGSIGAGVEVNTHDLKVDAQTHQKTTIEVQNKAEIKLHRGDLSAKEAVVEILETGKIQATESIHIKKMVGGEAIAPEVFIEELGSNATVIASKLIRIGSITGENATLTISPDAIEAYHTEKEKLQTKIQELQKEHALANELLEEKLSKHTEQLERIKTFQKRVLQAQKSGKTPMKQDMIRIKEYKRTAQRLQEEKEALHVKELEIEQLQQELDKLLEYDLHAKIVTNSKYNGHIKVTFINPENSQEVSDYPQGIFPEISLDLDNENNRYIKK